MTFGRILCSRCLTARLQPCQRVVREVSAVCKWVIPHRSFGVGCIIFAKPKRTAWQNSYRNLLPESEKLNSEISDSNAIDPTMPQFNQWHSVFQKLCGESDRFVSVEEWQNAYEEAIRDPKLGRGFFGALMSIATSFRYFQFGDSMIAYFRTKNIPLNFAVAGKYVKLCSLSTDSAKEEKIESVYGEMLKISPNGVFDAATAENLIAGFYMTQSWRNCFRFLECIEMTARAGPVVLSYLAAGCFLHDEPALAKTFLERIKNQKSSTKQPSLPAFKAWFDLVKKQGWNGILEMLEYLRDASWFLPFEVAKELKEFSEKRIDAKWTGRFTTVSVKGECKACHEYLTPITIKREEFESLRKAFINLVATRNDIFLHTNPSELLVFRDFIEKNAPFDVVVDGLNAAYFQNTSRQTPKTLVHQLRIVIEHIIHRQNKKVLVLGRKHMQSWPREEMTRIRDIASVFLAENSSEDDHFLLYAAIYSGLECVVLSGDLYRDYRFKVESSNEDLRKIFLKWQRTHQLELLKVHLDDTVRIKATMKYDTVPQWTPNSMHIPYDSGIPRSLHELPTTWLCLTKDSRIKE